MWLELKEYIKCWYHAKTSLNHWLRGQSYFPTSILYWCLSFFSFSSNPQSWITIILRERKRETIEPLHVVFQGSGESLWYLSHMCRSKMLWKISLMRYLFPSGLVSHFNILLASWRQKLTTPKNNIFPIPKPMFSKKQSCICGRATLLVTKVRVVIVLVVSIEKEYGVTRYMWCPSYIKWILQV